MAKISRDDVLHVALLSRVELTEEELELFQSQLAGILAYVEKLKELSTEDAEPMTSVMGLHDVFREDEPRASLGREEALANAPDRDEDSFRVPAVVE
ncbi:MAG: Asp-tRNA(Asn)/Glu-tRNA(Gln) amidotransferase subunit GatC [Planctomycetes bacterium]|nr:Asp-tRNA(Asn)/Glu-tRNA(Gln) amidotransferase subunit GatC [Planctomycetota bacterium]